MLNGIKSEVSAAVAVGLCVRQARDTLMAPHTVTGLQAYLAERGPHARCRCADGKAVLFPVAIILDGDESVMAKLAA